MTQATTGGNVVTQLPDFKSINERDQYFLDHAEMFTVVRRLSPYSIDRHGCRNFSAAKRLATELAAKFQKPYMIYAVIGPYDSFVEAVQPQPKCLPTETEMQQRDRR